jgi:hypothetical protein
MMVVMLFTWRWIFLFTFFRWITMLFSNPFLFFVFVIFSLLFFLPYPFITIWVWSLPLSMFLMLPTLPILLIFSVGILIRVFFVLIYQFHLLIWWFFKRSVLFWLVYYMTLVIQSEIKLNFISVSNSKPREIFLFIFDVLVMFLFL